MSLPRTTLGLPQQTAGRSSRTSIDLGSRWTEWRLARNRRGTYALACFGLVLYPLFGILDYLSGPAAYLWVLWSIRMAVVLAAAIVLWILPRPLFARYPNWISATALLLGASGISIMTVFLGGLASPYYAGLVLPIVASGLLFVWPETVVITTHALIILTFVALNVAFAPSRPEPVAAISNLFFLTATAVIIATGQIVNYRNQRVELGNQLLLERTKSNLEAAHQELQELDRHKSDFFANITHELKTPLAMVLVPIELMLEGPDTKDLEAYRPTLQTMHRHSMKMLKLVNDMLDLTKLENSRLRLSIAEHDIVGYLRDLTAQSQPLAKRKSIDLSFHSEVPSARIWCDIERLERVFVNLLSNALKFTPNHGHVSGTVIDEPDAVSIQVTDDGIGFPPHLSERVFERFFQVDSGGTRKHGGAGIGLALAKELVELHGGTIRARSLPNEGATFTVWLPKGRNHFAATNLERRQKTSDRPGGQRLDDRGVGEWQLEAGARYRLLDIDEATEQRTIDREADDVPLPYTVLVVEDTPDVARLIHLTLRRQCRILVAGDGAKGWELAVAHLPNLIVTDLMMPGVDGLELTRRLREDPRTRHIPIVMLTARGDLQDRITGIETGVNAYLTKPFSPQELRSTVRSLLQQQELAADAVLSERMDSLETIAGGLAHEINNPLNYIKGALVAIEQDAKRLKLLVPSSCTRSDGEPQRHGLEAIEERLSRMLATAHQGVRRIGKTVDLMRRYSREGYTRVVQPYDIHRGVRDVLDVVVPAMGRNVQVETSFQGEGAIPCVPEEMNQVLSNLIQNAIEAVADVTGRVHISVRQEGVEVVLSVRDNGHGIAPHDRSRVFTPFFTTKDVGHGLGLGLTITHRVVTSLSGTIRVHSPADGGTEFVVRLPRNASSPRAGRS